MLNFFYSGCILLGTPFYLVWMILKYPRTVYKTVVDSLLERLGCIPENLSIEETVWVHAASLGEWKAVVPFLTRLKERIPKLKFIFSTQTVAGKEFIQKLNLGADIYYAPLDIGWIVNKWIRKAEPDLCLIVETEIWPNMIQLIKKNRIPVGIINARLSERSCRRYGWIKAWLTPILNQIDFILAREKEDLERFQRLGIAAEKITLAGNLKYDISIIEEDQEWSKFGQNQLVIVAGSTREGEEELIVKAFQKVQKKIPKLRLILAPRHIERKQSILKLCSFTSASLRSQIHNPQNWESSILVWDTLGTLNQAYSAATVVVMGGTFVPKGGQNPIEPALLRKPILCGSSVENFKEPFAVLLRSGGARLLNSFTDLEEELLKILDDQKVCRTMGESAYSAIFQFCGKACAQTIKSVTPYLMST